MRKFVGKQKTKKIPFMGDKIEIRKLTTGQIKEIGKQAASIPTDSEDKAFLELVYTFQAAVVLEEGEDEITLGLLEEFPLDELISLSKEIMTYAGVPGAEGNVS